MLETEFSLGFRRSIRKFPKLGELSDLFSLGDSFCFREALLGRDFRLEMSSVDDSSFVLLELCFRRRGAPDAFSKLWLLPCVVLWRIVGDDVAIGSFNNNGF
jgi:hypothetical protein